MWEGGSLAVDFRFAFLYVKSLIASDSSPLIYVPLIPFNRPS